jgi:hypothetical protein
MNSDWAKEPWRNHGSAAEQRPNAAKELVSRWESWIADPGHFKRINDFYE